MLRKTTIVSSLPLAIERLFEMLNTIISSVALRSAPVLSCLRCRLHFKIAILILLLLKTLLIQAFLVNNREVLRGLFERSLLLRFEVRRVTEVVALFREESDFSLQGFYLGVHY